MRTVLAPGAGTPIQLMSGSCAPKGSGARVLFARIEPARAEGPYPAGSYDDAGYGLHLEYSIGARDAVQRLNYPGVKELDQTNDLVVKLGPGSHWLNYPGEVRLAGGSGLWVVDVQVLEVEAPRPHWHWLLRRLRAGERVSVAEHHERVGCSAGLVRMQAWDGSTVRLSATPVPVVGPLMVTDPFMRSVWIFSGFYG